MEPEKKSGHSRSARILMFVILLIIIVAIIISPSYLRFIKGWDWADWTGFSDYRSPTGEFQRAKTLWDLMSLLIVPAVIAVGAWGLNKSEKENEQKVESDRQRQAALESYFDCMTNLLLKEHLRDSHNEDEVRSIARSRTLAILRVLDEDRKVQALQFLYESGLISKNPIICLNGANLEGARLEDANLRGVEIRGAYLNGAYLNGANLAYADLRGSDFSGADLRDAILTHTNLTAAFLRKANMSSTDLEGADLTWVDLTDANLTSAKLRDEQLRVATTKENMIMPDGKKFRSPAKPSVVRR